MSKTLQIFLVVALVGLGAAYFAWREWGPRERSVKELTEDVFYSDAHEWFAFYAEEAPERTGWVHLPTEHDDPSYESDINPSERGYVGPAACAECHKDKVDGFLHTAHAKTSAPANADTVLGDFASGKNVVKTRNGELQLELVNRDGELFQRVIIEKNGKTYTHEERFDIVTGSGNHGQTYLYWHGDRLCQLPVSYFTEKGGWVNSPGMYLDGTADFARGIAPRCLDCHATFVADDPESVNRYDRETLVYGVTCVRCHGRGWAHIQYHKTHPEDKDAKYITNPSKLDRDRMNEVCAQCHSGVGTLNQAPFSYQPGTPLHQHLTLDMDTDKSEHDDPHAANQLLRLMKSKCFQESENLTCATCHDPHQQERGKLALFADRCGKCHEQDACGLSDQHGELLEANCIRCHLPSRRDATSQMRTAEGNLLPLLRDHLIGVWPDATETTLKELGVE